MEGGREAHFRSVSVGSIGLGTALAPLQLLSATFCVSERSRRRFVSNCQSVSVGLWLWYTSACPPLQCSVVRFLGGDKRAIRQRENRRNLE